MPFCAGGEEMQPLGDDRMAAGAAQEFGGAAFEGDFLAYLAVGIGHQGDRRIHAEVAQTGQHVEPRQIGQFIVRDDHVELVPGDGPRDGGLRGSGLDDPESLTAQVIR